MKILHIIPSMDPAYGGPCKCLRDLIPAWSASDDLHEVVCLDDPASHFLGKDPFAVYAIGQRSGPLGFHKNLIPWLEAHLTNYGAAVVHGLWQWHSFATWMTFRKLRKTQASQAPGFGENNISSQTRSSKIPAAKIPPYFVMPHGNLDPWFQRAPSRRIKAIRNWIYWKLNEYKLIRDAKALLFTCEEELKLARETFRPYAPKAEVVVGLGVPAPPPYLEQMSKAFHDQIPSKNPGTPYLLFLSRIHPKKGVDLLIKAYAEVFAGKATDIQGEMDQTSPSIQATGSKIPALVIAGPLDSEYAQKMIRLAESLLPRSVFIRDKVKSSELDSSSFREPEESLAALSLKSSNPQLQTSENRPTIHFSGMLHGDAKWGAFYGCEYFILPSHQENFGIAVVEALACGKPVLISNKVNIWREIESSGGGITAEDSPAGTVNLITSFYGKKGSFNPIGCYRNHFEVTAPARRFHQAINRDQK